MKEAAQPFAEVFGYEATLNLDEVGSGRKDMSVDRKLYLIGDQVL